MPLAALLTILSACGKYLLTDSSVAGKWQVDSIGLKSTGSNGVETTTTISEIPVKISTMITGQMAIYTSI